MANDRRDVEYYRRGRARYVRQHAHLLGAAAVVICGGPEAPIGRTARCAVELAEEIYDSLPDDPDAPPSPAVVAELDIPPLPDSHEAPAPLLPVEPEITTRAAAASAARTPRRPVSERLARLADCKTSTDAATIAAYHAHLASSGLQDCGACGLVFDVGALNPGRPFEASTAELEALVRYVANAPIQEDAGAEGAGVSP